ncbi:MAG: DUF2760 domain-containing protein [Myxococcota bacterium]
MRIWLAFRAFFAVLFGAPWPPAEASLPPPTPKNDAIAEARAALSAPPAPEPPPPAKAPEPAPPAASPPPAKIPDGAAENAAAVQVLGVLQAEGRLLDFLSEDIDGYSDSDIGAAVRDIHRGLKKALVDHFPVEHVRSEEEDARISVPAGYDPSEIRLTGNVVGSPPFSGRLKHRGWRVTSVRLPRAAAGVKVVAPAEVEL